MKRTLLVGAGLVAAALFLGVLGACFLFQLSTRGARLNGELAADEASPDTVLPSVPRPESMASSQRGLTGAQDSRTIEPTLSQDEGMSQAPPVAGQPIHGEPDTPSELHRRNELAVAAGSVTGMIGPLARAEDALALGDLDALRESALAWLQTDQKSMKDPAQIALGRTLFIEWGKLEPEAALAAFYATPNRSVLSSNRYAERHTLLDPILRAWAEDDPDAMTDWAIRDLNKRGFLAARALVSADLPRAFDWADANAAHVTLQAAVAREAFGRDPGATMNWIASIEGQQQRDYAINWLSPQLLHHDSVTASSMVQSIARKSLRELAIKRMGASWAASDVESAMAWASGLEGDNRNVAYRAISETWARKGMNDLSLLDSVDEAGMYWAVTGVLGGLAETNPSEAAEVVALIDREDSVFASDSPHRASYELLSVWRTGKALGAADSRNAAEWAVNLKNEQLRNSALSGVIQGWGPSDPVGAAEWVMGLNDVELRDNTAFWLVNKINGKSPRVAADLALTIQDEKKRSQMSRQAVGNWTSRDPQAVVRWARETGLSRDEAISLDKRLAGAWPVEI